MTVTAALAIANYAVNNNVTSQVVADTAANLVSSLSGLAGLVSHSKLTSVTLTDNDPIFQATAAQTASLASLPNFALATGATLLTRDTAANLLLPGNAAGLAKATGVSVSGTSNTVTAAQSATLAAMPVFTVATGAKLVVSDTATNLLLSSNTAGLAKATGVSLSGANIVTAAQATKLVGLHSFGLATGATMAVSDTAASILASANATGLAKATAVSLSGANTVTAAQATILATLTGFALGSGATLVLSDSAANLLASGNAPGLVFATAVSLTGTSNTVTAAQAATLAGLHGFALASGASLAVVDSASRLLAGWQRRRRGRCHKLLGDRDQYRDRGPGNGPCRADRVYRRVRRNTAGR